MPDARPSTPPDYRFGDFVLSPGRRLLTREAREVALIPRYFDLLVLLVERRHEAVHRREIFDRVWGDVVVSDGALGQAVRTLRRTLGDDPRNPRFIRTVPRHGYQFVFPDVLVELGHRTARDATTEAPTGARSGRSTTPAPPGDPFEPLIEKLLGPASDEERREAAEQLHGLGTAEALGRLDERPGHQAARALLRDARWDVPGAGAVPILGVPGAVKTVAALVAIRLRRALRQAGDRWASAAGAGAAAGGVAGIAGGLALLAAPGSNAGGGVVGALAFVGAVAGGLGATGVGAGLTAAEALVRSRRGLALVLCGAAGGGLVASAVHIVGRVLLAGVFGRDAGVGGSLEGLVIGAATGLGYALSTRGLPGGGMASPHGRARLRTVSTTAASCAVAAGVLSAVGGHLIASSLDEVAAVFDGSDVGLAPLATLLGEQELRPVTRTIVGAFEGLLFGAGTAFGLTHRPRPVDNDDAARQT